MKRVLVGLLAIAGGLLVILIGAAVVIAVGFAVGTKMIPSRTVLEIDLERAVVEDVPDDPLAKVMFEENLVVRGMVDALQRAGGDDRVVGVLARVGAGGMGLATVQEVRDALGSFRASGKPAVAYSETFGEFGPGNGGYYLATACDEIYMQPSGDIGLTGLLFESPFLNGTLEKLGITPRMDHRYEYKNMMNMYTEKEFTKAHREATQAIMDSQFSQMARGIAAARGLDEGRVRELFDGGPYLGQEAVDAGLVDGLAYRDQVRDRLAEKIGVDEPSYLAIDQYLDRAGSPYESGETVALIFGVGGVVRGASGFDPVMGELTMGSDTVAGAFREAVADGDVKAILFRVDSPGGSYVASDTIWREVVRAREAGKPVVVSMGDVAGSGGYFVAMAADKIVAQPGTITASIGVLSGKMLTSGFWDKVGLSWDEVHSSANATMWTGTHDYTEAEWARFQAWLDRIYEDFTSKVAQGRNLPKERVLEIAKGRVWTGEDARALGLVDGLGGYPEALRLLRESLGLAEDAPIHLKTFPEKRSLFQLLLDEGGRTSSGAGVAVLLVRVLEVVRPVARVATQLGLVGRPTVLRVPDVPHGS